MYRKLEESIFLNREKITADRRALHRIPETAWNEKETQRYLVKRLTEMSGEDGYRLFTGKCVTGYETGIVAELDCPGKSAAGSLKDCVADGKKTPVIALRFDMDALPVTEPEDGGHLPAAEGFASTHPGTMHACGHDGHMAIGLACAEAFLRFRDAFHGKIRLIFQPAEEGARGAREIVQRGWLDDADCFLAGHIVGRDYHEICMENIDQEKQTDPADGTRADEAAGSRTDKIDVIPGVSASLATTKLDAVFTGRSCHAAEPEKGLSVLPAMAEAVLALRELQKKRTEELQKKREEGLPEKRALVNTGRICAGEGRNIIAGSGSMELETRGSTTQLNGDMEENTCRILKECANRYGVEAEITVLGRAPSLESSPELCELSRKICDEKLENVRSGRTPQPFKASEDAPVMLNRVKERGGLGIFFLFPTDTTAPLHNSRYDFSEEILPKAAAVFVSMVYCHSQFLQRTFENQ